MPKAIFTKYLGPTNTKGARVRAYAEGGNAIVTSWDYGQNVEQNHARAARLLCEKMSWRGSYVQGGHADGRQYVHVNVTPDWAARFDVA